MHQHDILPIANFSATPLPVEIEKERARERERARIFIVEEVPHLRYHLVAKSALWHIWNNAR